MYWAQFNLLKISSYLNLNTLNAQILGHTNFRELVQISEECAKISVIVMRKRAVYKN